jgi:hypothetical protein
MKAFHQLCWQHREFASAIGNGKEGNDDRRESDDVIA